MFQVLERDLNGRIIKFTMRRPDNWHGHLRRGARMEAVVADKDTITFERLPWIVPSEYHFGDNDVVVPLCAGETMGWRVVSY